MAIITGDQVRWATLELLRQRLPAYLAAQLAQVNAYLPPEEQLAAPAAGVPWVRNWTRLADFRALDASQSPSVVVTTAGITDVPVRDEDGNYAASWLVMAFAVVREQSYERTAALVGLYTGALRECLAQHQLPGLITRRRWVGELYNELGEPDDTRTIGAGRVDFEVDVADVLQDMPLDGPQVAASMVAVQPYESDL